MSGPQHREGVQPACMLVLAAATEAAPSAVRQSLARITQQETQGSTTAAASPPTDAWQYHVTTADSDARGATLPAAAPPPPPPPRRPPTRTPPGALSPQDHVAASREVRHWQRALLQLCGGNPKTSGDAAHPMLGHTGTDTRGEVTPSLLWTHVPRSKPSLDGAAAPPLDEAHGTPRTQLLCVDVGGYYATCTAAPPLTESSEGHRMHGGATATTSRTQKSASSAGASPCDGAERELMHLLQHRFASALPSCPAASSAAAPVVLEEVWVVVLGSPEARWTNASDDGFPQFTPCGTSAACSAEGSGKPSDRCARVAGYPPRYVLRLPDWLARRPTPSGHDNQAPGQEAVARLCGFKRPREDAGSIPQMPEQKANGGSVTRVLCDAHAVSTAVRSVRVRLLHRAFLHRSSFFSEWCCASDFDMTAALVGDGGEADAATTAVHGLYGALRRAHRVTEARVMEVAREHLMRGMEIRTPLVAGTAVDTLFEDPVVLTQRTETTDRGTDAQRAVVWDFEDVWRWWVQLGWTPALTRTPLRLRLPSLTCDARDAVRQGPVTELLPRAVCHLLAEVAAEVDRSYIHARCAQLDRGAVMQEGEDVVVTHDTSRCGTHQIPSKSNPAETELPDFASQREALVQLQQLFRFRAALHDMDDGGGLSTPAPGTMRLGEAHAAHGTASSFQSAEPMWSEAARELAADITIVAATGAHRATPGLAEQPTVDPALVASLVVPWLRGVLDAPALLLCPAQTKLEAFLDADGAAPLHALCGSDAAPLVASLLPACGGVQSLAVMPPALREAATRLELADGEAGCEVADVAELRWWPTTAPAHCVFEAADEHSALAPAPSDVSSPSSPSSCERAHREIACLARCRTPEEAAAVLQEAERQLRSTDSLAALLLSGFAELLKESGLVAFAAAAAAAPTATTVVEAAEAASTGTAPITPTTTAATDTPPVQAEVTRLHAEHRALAAAEALLSWQDAGEGEDGAAATASSLQANEADAVTACVSDAVVRVVHQNRQVVRRMLALIQSYQLVVDDVAAAQREGGDAALPEAEASATETLAGDVWRCVSSPTSKPSTNMAVPVGNAAYHLPPDVSTSATAAAQRLVRTFWENVAAAVRSRLAPHTGACVDKVADVPCGSEDEDQETGQETGSVSDSLGDGAGEDADSSRERGSVISASSAAAFPSRSKAGVAPTSAAAAPTWRCPQPAAALAWALAALDGAQAMAMYMQRIACSSAVVASSDATRTRGHRLCNMSPLPRATVPERSVPTSAGALESPQLGQQLWVQHALFLLSYGLARPADQVSAPAATATGCAPASSVPPSPPALAAFRAMRYDKLVLDGWIVAALESYVRRWERHVSLA